MHIYMLDTDISSYVMKRSHPAILHRLASTRIGEVCISVVTKAELMYGVKVSPRPTRDQPALNEYLLHVEVLDLPEPPAEDYAELRAELKRRGNTIGANDLWIAAHARCLGLTLVTNNAREFSRVRGLMVENWTN